MTRLCAGCGDRVLWLVTKSRGRPMPVNPEVVIVHFIPTDQGTEADKEATWRRITILTADGIIRRGYQLPSPRPGSVKISGRTAHLATCPKADYYRKRAALKRVPTREGAPDDPR